LVSSRVAALSLWPHDAVIVEVGVGLGDFSQEILRICRPRRFIAIDSFILHELDFLWGKPIRDYFGENTHEEFYRQSFASEIATHTVALMSGDSSEMISALPDQSVDIFYVDADHSYEGVRRDLEALRSKVKPDGWVVMNDYTPAEIGLSNEPYGVIQATNEFMLTHGWEMEYFALAYVMYCDVGLRRAGVPSALPEGEIEHLRHVITSMRESTSWRITAPLRSLGRLLKRAGG
jgi:Methyltransferase domain